MPKTGLDDFLVANHADVIGALKPLIVAPDTRPDLNAGEPLLHVLVDDAWNVLLGPGSMLFRRGSQLIEIEVPDAGPPESWVIDEGGLRYALSERIDFWVFDRRSNQNRGVQPPAGLAKVMLSAMRTVPVIERIVTVPVFAPSGRLIQEPGYDEATRTYFAPIIQIPPVPRHPTAEELGRAVALILEMVGEFPFTAPADLAHAVAMGLEPFARGLIDGPTPIYLIRAPKAGTGKGLLAKILLRPSYGDWIDMSPPPEDDKECRKQITSSLIAGDRVFIIDNLEAALNFPSLAAAVTAGRHSDRVLGRSENFAAPVSWTWIVTANNPTMRDDLARRCVEIEIVADEERPDRRTFEKSDLMGWVAEREGELVAAYLTLIQAWVAEGMPPWEERVFGSFESWARVIGGILRTAGIDGFLQDADERYEERNVEAETWKELLERWWDRHQDKDVSVEKILALILNMGAEFAIGLGDEERKYTHRLSMRLSHRTKQTFGHLRIVRRGRKWGLVQVEQFRAQTRENEGDEGCAATTTNTANLYPFAETSTDSMGNGGSLAVLADLAAHPSTPHDPDSTPFERMLDEKPTLDELEAALSRTGD